MFYIKLFIWSFLFKISIRADICFQWNFVLVYLFHWTISVLINENWNKRNQHKIQLKTSLFLLLGYCSKIYFIFRSLANGNCISSIPLLLVGNNSLMDELRCLTSIVLYLHSEFCGKALLFWIVWKRFFKSIKSF